MKSMMLGIYGAAGLLTAIAACSANGTSEDHSPGPADTERDGGVTLLEAGPTDDAAPGVDPDAARPLRCGEAGFCETRLPLSDVGVPLSLRGVWVVASNDVWSVTAEGFVLHYDGTSWQTAYRVGVALSVVWATSTSVWAGGEAGILLHKDASGAWTQLGTDHLSTIRSISGTSDTDVWLASEDGLVDRFDGSTVLAYPIDIPNVRITAVAGRPGLGVYAAGYVKGGWGRESQDSQPYVLEMSPTGPSEFNAMPKGFTPVSLDVFDSPQGRKVFVFGYEYVIGVPTGATSYGLLERTGELVLHRTVSPRTLRRPQSTCELDRSGAGLFPCPAWMHASDDVVVPFCSDFEYAYLLRLNGTNQTSASLAMGSGFVPRTVLGVHGNSTDTWLVGDGFALKGATQ